MTRWLLASHWRITRSEFDRCDSLGVAAGQGFRSAHRVTCGVSPLTPSRRGRRCALRLPHGGRLTPSRAALGAPLGEPARAGPDLQTAAPQLARSPRERGGRYPARMIARLERHAKFRLLDFPRRRPCGPGFRAADRAACGVSPLTGFNLCRLRAVAGAALATKEAEHRKHISMSLKFGI